MFSNKLNYKIINITALMLLFYIGFSNIEMCSNLLKKIGIILFPFIVAFTFAYALYPLVNKLIRKGMKKKLAVIVVVIGFSLIILSLIIVTLPIIYDQLVLFSKYIISILNNVGNKYNINLGNLELKLTDYLNTIIGKLSNIISKGSISIVSKSVEFIGNFVVGYIAGIYFLYDMKKIRKKIKEVIKKISDKFYQYIKCMDKEIENYIKGLSILMIIQLFEYSLLFLLIGHPNWLLLGILASVTTIIPYIGGLVTNIIGIVIATTISTRLLIGTIIICLLFPMIDGYFISPKVYGKTNDINPLITIMLVSIGGTIFGIIGIIISLPLYLLIRTTYHFFNKNIKKELKKITTNI